MNQNTEPQKKTPLYDTLNKAGASFQSSDNWLIPGVYANAQEEYNSIKIRAGLLDRSHLGRLNISGSDALDLLNRLSTNSLIDLQVDHAASTVLTTAKGRIVDLLLVVNLGERLVVLTSPETPDKVIDWLDFYTFGEDITVGNDTNNSILLSVVGPSAGTILRSQGIPHLDTFESCQIPLFGQQVIVVRTDCYGLEGYEVMAPSGDASLIWASLKEAGAEPVGENALERVRVENGIPKYGHEIGEDFNPIEAGLLPSISFDKGCYIGQEVVLRLKTYDKVQKSLKHITISGHPSEGSSLEYEGKEVGIITSIIESQLPGESLAIGYVRNAYSESGQILDVKDGSTTSQGSVSNLSDLKAIPN